MGIAFGIPAFLNPRFPRGETVSLRRFVLGEPDAHGNASGEWVEAAILKGCGFDPGSSSEPRIAGQDRVIVEPALYVAFDAPILPADRVVLDSVEYEVEGVPRRWRSPFSGRAHGAVVSLRRVDG